MTSEFKQDIYTMLYLHSNIFIESFDFSVGISVWRLKRKYPRFSINDTMTYCNSRLPNHHLSPVRSCSIPGLLLRLVVLQRRFDGVLRQHGTVELDRRQGELLCDVRILDASRLIHGFTLVRRGNDGCHFWQIPTMCNSLGMWISCDCSVCFSLHDFCLHLW